MLAHFVAPHSITMPQGGTVQQDHQVSAWVLRIWSACGRWMSSQTHGISRPCWSYRTGREQCLPGDDAAKLHGCWTLLGPGQCVCVRPSIMCIVIQIEVNLCWATQGICSTSISMIDVAYLDLRLQVWQTSSLLQHSLAINYFPMLPTMCVLYMTRDSLIYKGKLIINRYHSRINQATDLQDIFAL